MKNKSARYLTVSAVCAALYAALTYLSAALGIAYGPIQFRISEALTLLPVLTPAAIPGLTVGCFLANLGSFNAIDMVIGTAATLLSAIFTRKFRNIKTFGLPLLSVLPPVIFNAFLIGVEISVFYLDGFTLVGFIVSALQVGLGELIVCCLLGIPLYLQLNKHNILN